MCKLSAIELSILVAGLELGINSPTATDIQKTVLSEMMTLSKELLVKWDNQKGQKLWALGAHKSLIEAPDFVKDTNGAKNVISAMIDKVNQTVVAAAIAALTAPVVTTAVPQVAAAPIAATPSAASEVVAEPLPGTPEFAAALAHERQLRKEGAKRTLWGYPVKESE